MASYVKGKLLNEGKTKKIWNVAGNPDLVLVENKSDITAYDNPELTKQFSTKAVCATETTCRVFEILKKAAIPVAYVEQISPTEFVAPKCTMIDLEVVARRYAVGSYLKRNPNFGRPEGERPVRFHRMVVEFFLKTTKGRLLGIASKRIVEELDPQKGEEDPLIMNPFCEWWTLLHSKKPLWDSAVILREKVLSSDVTWKMSRFNMRDLEDYLRDTFLVLEGMWAMLDYHIIDLKIEFGMTEKGELLVADVIDNDSWRLRDPDWRELSKENFRQGQALDKVEHDYGIVTEAIKDFRVPKQCLVFWRGSDKDEFPKISQEFELTNYINVVRVTASGHKAPRTCLDNLDNLSRDYPGGGVIIAKVGRSNGLGPMLAARTQWPVISIPATMDKNPEDIWSSLRMPSDVPMAVICLEANAIDFALNILAQKNPFLYQQKQRKIEDLDK